MSLTDDLSDQFFSDIIDMSSRLQLDPADMLSVMMAESNVTAAAHNAHSDAGGLIQFLPSTLQHLGWTGTTVQFRLLDADDQIPYVEKYFKPYVHFVLDSGARVYQVVFLPSSLSLGSGMDTIIVQQGGINSAAYPGNKGLDTNNDGAITVGELQQAIDRHHTAPRWKEIAARLNSATGGAADGGGDVAEGSAAAGNSDSGESGSSGGSGDGNTAIDLGTQQGLADALAALGFDNAAFVDAVKAFQQQQGLSVDGIVGPHTRAAVASALDDSGIAHTG